MMDSTSRLSVSTDRSSSRISIYDYPEHLNPFTEDDNHKRLRFWHLPKSNRNSKGRRSFSFGNLRDVWTFRSFNLKKKSSTLGIQKTSESPPILRRNLNSNTQYFNPEDQPPNNRRPLMMSLQNVSTPLGMTMGRGNSNSHYHGKPYFDRCSTPQPQRYQTMRSSFSSLTSTNPFESEIESDVTNTESPTVGLRTKTYRKKRKAPAIPTQNLLKVPSTNAAQEKSVDSSPSVNIEDLDIKSLTSEIERFVSHSNETSDSKLLTRDLCLDSKSQRNEEPSLFITEDTNNHISNQEHTFDAKEGKPNVPQSSKELLRIDLTLKGTTSNSNKSTQEHIDTKEENNVQIAPPSEDLVTLKVNTEVSPQEHILNPKEENHLTKNIVISGKITNSTQEQIRDAKKENNKVNTELTEEQSDVDVNSNASTQKKIVIKKGEISNEISSSSPEHLSVNVSSPAIENTNYNICIEEQIPNTKDDNNNKEMTPPRRKHFTNSKLDYKTLQLDKVANNTMQVTRQTDQNNYNSIENKRCENNNITESSEHFNNPLTIFENTQQNSHSSQENSKATKAKSVKEIIDSINRSQRLLKESAAKGTNVYSTALYSTKSSIPIANNNMQRNEVIQNDISAGSLLDNHVQLKETDFQKNKIDKIVFQCRESSPTASNLDWNPVPKPKRINSDSKAKDINEL